jgi:hypothetical protein
LVDSKNKVEMLDNIPVKLDTATTLKRLRMHGESKKFETNISELIEIVTPILRPKALYKVSYVESRNGDSVVIDGVTFTGKLLKVNLEKVERVFPIVVTSGREIDAIKLETKDVVRSYCLEAIKIAVVVSASMYVQELLTKQYATGQLSSMNPGETDLWPITQQKPLFSLLGGDVEERIGVKLTEGCTMVPVKSRSGILFSPEKKFESCQVCQREKCIGRRAVYNPELAKKYRDSK